MVTSFDSRFALDWSRKQPHPSTWSGSRKPFSLRRISFTTALSVSSVKMEPTSPSLSQNLRYAGDGRGFCFCLFFVKIEESLPCASHCCTTSVWTCIRPTTWLQGAPKKCLIIPIPTKIDENGWCTYPKTVPLVVYPQPNVKFKHGQDASLFYQPCQWLEMETQNRQVIVTLFSSQEAVSTEKEPRSAARDECRKVIRASF